MWYKVRAPEGVPLLSGREFNRVRSISNFSYAPQELCGQSEGLAFAEGESAE